MKRNLNKTFIIFLIGVLITVSYMLSCACFIAALICLLMHQYLMLVAALLLSFGFTALCLFGMYLSHKAETEECID